MHAIHEQKVNTETSKKVRLGGKIDHVTVIYEIKMNIINKCAKDSI